MHPAPAETGHPAVVGPFYVHLLRVAVVSTELYQVPAEAFGFDAGLVDQHRFSSPVTSVLMHAPSTVEAELWPGASHAISRKG